MKWFNTYPKYSSILLINTSQFKTEINFKNKTSMSLSYLTPSYFLKSGPDSDFSDWFKQFCSFFFFFFYSRFVQIRFQTHSHIAFGCYAFYSLFAPKWSAVSLTLLVFLPSTSWSNRVLFNVPCFAIG